ncbi:16S rRNA (cytosine(1402)-N(4))-methyltransferase RsmH [Candidatus Mycoplasma mahonii]|uniref:16S rRNA (cytosine(1402)-N(4))-methyltransferase RsmH n=1 Tax=Candidatus Mycoplasma mahonii TaxID=3004105 RepID=UPI0026EBC966|nr:16S rRNA (cytosine(1402)-N(4))-methyltransferase RsmH [Candidatus Mycoplasma mahonii]WKX02740.1 16S rRNA (cytosine(1402)-N(4))-methyltransferase RsmH [Candidatus Mycoplasma mahonii]
MTKHISVMLTESMTALSLKPDGVYVDLTLGRGGHSSEILKTLENGMLLAFDKDKTALIESASDLNQISNKYQLVHSDYRNLKNELDKLGINVVDGIFADLGVSSPQLDEAQRGFSYSKDAPLDMRMNQNQEVSAYDIVNSYSEEELVKIFWSFADVKLPKRVAKGIISNRPVKTTLELVDVIRSSLPAAIVRKKNPAKAVFQAIRIAVNEELESLEKMLIDATDLLRVGGSLAIITFHSIEDRIVKRFFKQFIEDKTGKLPIIIERKWTAKNYKPSKNEIEVNRRSRSAKLRVLTKLKD